MREADAALLADSLVTADLSGTHSHGVLRVPEDFLDDEGPVRDLRGTVVVLHDAGYTDDEALEWLLGEDDTLGAAPIDALRAGRRAEVRRVAQSLAF